MLDLKLDTFLVLCKTRNYTKTANILNITQPAVTQHIQSLEKHYQTKLTYFDEKRQLHLTEQGRLLRDFAQTVSADSARLQEILKNMTEPETIRLGTLNTTGEWLVPHIVAEYIRRYPARKICMYLGEADDMLVQLQNGYLQFCITDIYCPPDEYESEELFRSETVCVCSPDHPLADQTVDFKDLNPYRLIFREDHTYSHQNLIQILHKHNQDLKSFHSYVEVGNINAVKQLVMENIGISFIYRFVVEEDLKNGKLKQIHIHNFSSPCTFSFAWMKNSYYTPQAREFLDVCKATLRSSGVSPLL